MLISFHLFVSSIASSSSIIVLIPQLWYSVSKNNTDGLSLYFLIFQSFSAIFWLMYAFSLNEIAMMFSEFFYTISSILLLTLKLIHLFRKKNLDNENNASILQ